MHMADSCSAFTLSASRLGYSRHCFPPFWCFKQSSAFYYLFEMICRPLHGQNRHLRQQTPWLRKLSWLIRRCVFESRLTEHFQISVWRRECLQAAGKLDPVQLMGFDSAIDTSSDRVSSGVANAGYKVHLILDTTYACIDSFFSLIQMSSFFQRADLRLSNIRLKMVLVRIAPCLPRHRYILFYLGANAVDLHR